MRDDPRLIRAHIALFQGKPGETKRLVDDYVDEQTSPETTRRWPLIQWLMAQAHLKHQDRVDALTSLVENSPADDTYHQIAHNFLEDEQRFTERINAIDSDQPRQFLGLRLWLWGVVALLVLAAIIGITIVLLTNRGEPGESIVAEVTAEATAEATSSPIATETPTITPTPTAEQNEPFDVLEIDERVLSYFPAGELFIDAVDDNVQVVLDADGVPLEPMTGARFYALLIHFECRQALCHQVPEADLFIVLENASLGQIPALENVTIPNAQIEAGMLDGAVAIGAQARGWVVFEVPIAPEPAALRVVPRAIVVNGTPTPIATVEENLPDR